MKNRFVESIVNELKGLVEVEAVLLAGSYAAGKTDENSDFDLYVYLNRDLHVEKRKAITDKYCSYMEHRIRAYARHFHYTRYNSKTTF